MWVLILEALLALCLFLFIIWWTMFSGRRKGERAEPLALKSDTEAQSPADPQAGTASETKAGGETDSVPPR